MAAVGLLLANLAAISAISIANCVLDLPFNHYFSAKKTRIFGDFGEGGCRRQLCQKIVYRPSSSVNSSSNRARLFAPQIHGTTEGKAMGYILEEHFVTLPSDWR